MMWNDVIKGFCLEYLLFVILGIVLRIRRREWTRTETLLLVFWLGHALLVVSQVLIAHGGFNRRYLLSAFPLSLGWAGYAMHAIGSKRRLWLPLLVYLLAMFGNGARHSLDHCMKRNRADIYEITRMLASVIQTDWKHRQTFYRPELFCHQYTPPTRPVVESAHLKYLGYEAGGSYTEPCLYPQVQADYRIFINASVEPPYVEIHQETFNGKVYRVGKRTSTLNTQNEK